MLNELLQLGTPHILVFVWPSLFHLVAGCTTEKWHLQGAIRQASPCCNSFILDDASVIEMSIPVIMFLDHQV
jgi:hypothetical protein